MYFQFQFLSQVESLSPLTCLIFFSCNITGTLAAYALQIMPVSWLLGMTFMFSSFSVISCFFLSCLLHRCKRVSHFCTTRCYASAVLAMGLCLSVCLCLSLTSRSFTKTAKRRITQTKARDRDSCFLLPKISTKFDRGLYISRLVDL